MSETLSISELADLTGVSTHTLRYYEKEGLVPLVGRTPSGRHRCYTQRHVGWIKFLRRLRRTEMPIADLREYVALLERGEGETMAPRMEILARHRQRVVERIVEMQATLAVLDDKIQKGCGPRREASDGGSP